MARGRMISKSLSTSQKFAALWAGGPLVAQPLADFCAALYMLLVAHADDFGRLQGDSFTVKHQVFPAPPRSLEDFAAALEQLAQVGLVLWYERDGHRYLQIVDFEKHQAGLQHRTQSRYPDPSDPGRAPTSGCRQDDIDASERDIERRLAQRLLDGRLRIEPFHIVHIDHQVRIGSRYLDIVAKTAEGATIVVEVKRQRVTTAALRQVRRYGRLIGGGIPVVVGHGLAAGLDLPSDVLVGVYDSAEVNVRGLTSLNVMKRSVTFSNVQREENLRELNGTKDRTSTAVLKLERSEVIRKEDPGASRRHRPRKDKNPRALRALVRAVIQDAGFHPPAVGHEIGELSERIKDQAARAGIDYTYDGWQQLVETMWQRSQRQRRPA